MEYEIVTLEAKHIAGITAQTNNFAPDCGAVIGGLWERFYQDAFGAIPNKANTSSIALYHHYVSDEKSDYDITIGCETTAKALPKELDTYIIPSGKYAKFTIKGHVQTAVHDFWQNLWLLPLNRRFEADFEVYTGDDMENMQIEIYIGLAE